MFSCMLNTKIEFMSHRQELVDVFDSIRTFVFLVAKELNMFPFLQQLHHDNSGYRPVDCFIVDEWEVACVEINTPKPGRTVNV